MHKVKDILRQLITIMRYPKLFMLAKRVGKNNRLGPGGRFYNHREIHLGDNIYIGPDFHISGRNLRIGNGIMIGPNLLLECDDHLFRTVGKSVWETRKERNLGFVTIEDDVWIGGNATILKNVVVGEGCVIGAASVVTKSLPPYTICIGTPCRPVRTRFSRQDLITHLSSVTTKYTPEEIFSIWEKNNVPVEDK